jgi:hypothetical protein
MDVVSARRARGAAAQAVKFERVFWSREAERGLNKTFGDDRDVLISGVLDGTIELNRVNGGQAWLATRIDGKTLIVVAVQGKGLLSIAPLLHAAAKSRGLKDVRFWTRRPALARMLKNYGFDQTEVCFRMVIA